MKQDNPNTSTSAPLNTAMIDDTVAMRVPYVLGNLQEQVKSMSMWSALVKSPGLVNQGNERNDNDNRQTMLMKDDPNITNKENEDISDSDNEQEDIDDNMTE